MFLLLPSQPPAIMQQIFSVYPPSFRRSIAFLEGRAGQVWLLIDAVQIVRNTKDNIEITSETNRAIPAIESTWLMCLTTSASVARGIGRMPSRS